MTTQPKDLAHRAFRRPWEHLTPTERHVLEHVAARTPIAENPNEPGQDTRTFGERMSDRIALKGGSWGFVLTFLVFMIGWVLLNTYVLLPAGDVIATAVARRRAVALGAGPLVLLDVTGRRRQP